MPVSQVFSDEMWTELKALMVAQGWDVEATEALWASDFSKVRQRQARCGAGHTRAPICSATHGAWVGTAQDHLGLHEGRGPRREAVRLDARPCAGWVPAPFALLEDTAPHRPPSTIGRLGRSHAAPSAASAAWELAVASVARHTPRNTPRAARRDQHDQQPRPGQGQSADSHLVLQWRHELCRRSGASNPRTRRPLSSTMESATALARVFLQLPDEPPAQ